MMPYSDEEKLRYKLQLKAACEAVLKTRVDTARQAMEAAQESANSEEKSSAGDKYEVGRAMSQIDRDRSAAQMEEAMQDLLRLQGLDTSRLYPAATHGAVVLCGGGIYFIAAGIGSIDFAGEKVFVLSPLSPLAQALRDKTKNNTVTFNGRTFQIKDVF
jgi:hypothetical protein